MTDGSVGKRVWFKVLEPDELPPGRVKTATCAHRTVCLSHFEGEYAALDNRCPHQGGPLGEGSIEGGYLRCPWHGWDFHPLTGKPPGGYDDGVETFPVEVRDDGVYVGFLEEDTHVQTVSDLMVESMVEWGVKHVWGMVGHSNLGLADAMRRLEQQGRLSYYGIRHEGAAAFAASAYGKLTGRPAACFSIAGPGATNLLTGLWDANVDRSPVLALTGQVDSQVLGPGAFQEVDLMAAFGRVAQWSQTVLQTSKYSELVNLAVKSAVLNRGVSHLIFPDEVQNLPAPEGAKPGGPAGRMTPRTITPPQESLDSALDLLRKAERPVIIVGHGARFHMEDVVQLAETLDCPVITTFKGKGQISDHHPLGCGVLGRSGTPIASWFMNESDCLLVLGASFSNHTGITPKKPIIQVDYDPMILGKFHAVDVPVWGEIGVTVGLIRKGLEFGRAAVSHRAEIARAVGLTPDGLETGKDGQAGQAAVSQRAEIAERWEIWRTEKRRRMEDDRGQGISSSVVFDAMNQTVPENAIIPVDVGNNTYSFGRYFECSEQAVLMSGYLGSIGFSRPAALGAWAATQETGTPFSGRPVVSVSGDGGFGQYMAELTTAVKYGMNITHVLLNNSELGKISKEQEAGDWDVWQTALVNPNFADYATNCGALGIRVTDPADLVSALTRGIEHDGPALIEIITDAKLL